MYLTFPTISNQTSKGLTVGLGARMSRVTDCGHGKRGTRKGVRAKDEAGAYRQKATRVTCIGIYGTGNPPLSG